MKANPLWRIALLLAVTLAAGLAPAGATDLAAPAVAPAPAVTELPLLCGAETDAVPVADLFMPEPTAAAPTPICEIGCVDTENCRRDSDCRARPGGRCNLVCPKNGCCAYP